MALCGLDMALKPMAGPLRSYNRETIPRMLCSDDAATSFAAVPVSYKGGIGDSVLDTNSFFRIRIHKKSFRIRILRLIFSPQIFLNGASNCFHMCPGTCTSEKKNF
jgi:hypothetical protein